MRLGGRRRDTRSDALRCAGSAGRFDDPDATEWTVEERFRGFDEVALLEDYRTAETTQPTGEAGVVHHILFGRNEPALPHYHNAHRRGLGRPLLQVESA